MSLDPLHYREPRDYLDALLARQSRANPYAHLALAALYIGVAWYYGDGGLVRALLFAGAVGGVFVVVQDRLSERSHRHLTNGLLFGLSLLVQAYLPQLVIGPVALMPIGLAMFMSCRRVWCAVGLFGALVAAATTMPRLSVADGSLEAGAGIVFVAGTVAFLALAIATSIEGRFDGIAAARRRHVAAEAALRIAEADLSYRRGLLAQATEQLAERRASLGAQARRERAATAELARRRADERDLAQAIHHDLREPLRSIVSFSQLLRRRVGQLAGAERAAEMLAFVTDGGQRMATMLTDLHRYAGQESGGEADGLVDLGALAVEVVDDHADAIARTGAAVTADALPAVIGRASHLRQLLLNLVGNALKFGREGLAPVVTITSVAQPDGGAVVTVRDNGVGIPAPERERVFGLFNRVPGAAPREGSGVGLALCRRIALAHDFGLTCESEVGHGSAFHIGIPAAYVRTQGSGAPLPSPRHLDARLTAATSPA